MTTVTKPCGLCGWSVRCVMIAIFVVFGASAFAADPSKNVVTPTKQRPVTKTVVRKACFLVISGSACWQPCDRLSVIPTTAYQLDRIGGHSAAKE